MKYDAFISHASEDKADVARPLAQRLVDAGLRIWLDEFELTVGDSLRRAVDDGLAQSRFGIVILSPAFLSKEWPRKELDALVARDDGKQKIILPVWHDLAKDDIARQAPLLADKLAVSTSRGLDHVAEQLIRAIRTLATPPTQLLPQGIREALLNPPPLPSADGKPPRIRVLFSIAKARVRQSSDVIAKDLHMSSMEVDAHVKSLYSAGYIERLHTERGIRYTISKSGQQLLATELNKSP